MSRGANLFLGIVMLFIGAGFVAIAITAGDIMPAGPWPFYGCGLFCWLITLACVLPGSRQVTLRIIGAVVLAVCLFCNVYALDDPRFPKSLIATLVFGLPAGYVAITGRYPSWGKAAIAFNGGYKNRRIN